MPISYRILKDKHLVLVTTGSEASLNDAIQTLGLMFSDPEYSPEYDLLWDDSQRSTAFTPDDIQEILQHFKPYQGDKHPKRAFVVSQTVQYGMIQAVITLASVSSQAQIGLFHDRREALRWLDR
jgi:hypothetical protein